MRVDRFGQLTAAAADTKVLANASKHSAVNYARAGEMIEQLEREGRQLFGKTPATGSGSISLP